MAEDGGLTVVGVGQHLVVEIEVAGFGDVRRHGVEQPERIIAPEVLGRRGLFLTGLMGKRTNQRHRAAAFALGR